MKKYYLLEKEDTGHMSVQACEESLSLFYSRVGSWTPKCRGKLAVKITTVGDDYLVKVGEVSFTLDCGDLGNLRVALQELNKQQPTWFSKYISTEIK